MSEEKSYDLVVIGGGPAGYAGAIRAAQLGGKVACVESERAGGTCLNWGCIPTKALLKSAELVSKLAHAEDFGIHVEKYSFDFQKVIQRSRKVSDQMAKGIEFLFKKNKVDYIVGHAQVNVPGMVEITSGDKKGSFLATKNILLATGCRPRQLPGIVADGKSVYTSREILEISKQPKSLTVLGAGAIGVEFAYFFNALGTQVTLVEMQDQILPVEDAEVARLLERSFKKQGVDVRTKVKVENIRSSGKGVTMDLVAGDKKEEHKSEALLVAVGVQAYTEGLLSSRVNLAMDRGYVTVNDQYESSVKGIFAAGDIIGPPWLAHVATWEAVQAVNGIFGAAKPKRIKTFPGCTYCNPQVASVGLTEKAAKEKGIEYKIGKFPFAASGKAVASGDSEGFIKVLMDPKYGEILGAHIIGPDATELIAEYGLAINNELTAEEIHHTIHAHPTLSEGVMEAVAAAVGEAIHI
jgi:dihydrolipoamide dehydrogenase